MLACQVLCTPQSSARADSAQAYTFTTFAGKVGGGSTDGVGENAQFLYPSGITVDGEGTIYVSDTDNHTIRKITAAGVVSTLAGLATSLGNDDGVGTSARFWSPSGIAVDTLGNLFVADTDNNTIRKVTAAGVVSTLAGFAPYTGTNDGAGTNARFLSPGGIAVDTLGNLFVADTGNHTIRKITANGMVSTLAGMPGQSGSEDGAGSAARFNSPTGIAVDISGTLFVTDTENHTIRTITANGVVSTLAGLAGQTGNEDGAGGAARFDSLEGIAVDTLGNLFVADTGNHTIRKITAAGVVSTLAGANTDYGSRDGTGTNARFYLPGAITVNHAGTLFVADTFNLTIREITPAGVVSTLVGLPGRSPGSADGTGSSARFTAPRGIVASGAGTFFVTDTEEHTIRKVTSAGVVSTFAGLARSLGGADGTGDSARFGYPTGITVDALGNLFVTENGANTIRKITAAGVVSTVAGLYAVNGSADGAGTNARFDAPEGIAVDTLGTLYVTDSGNHTIRKITANGMVSTLAGLAGQTGSDDGAGGAARFNGPMGIAVDTLGTLFVTDTYNHTIRKITTNGMVSTLAGLPGQIGSDNGTGGAARFARPWGIALNGDGTLYVADTYNHVVRRITASGEVSTIAGSMRRQGNADGVGYTALFKLPTGIALDTHGDIFITDTGNNTIRKGVFTAYVPANRLPNTLSAMDGQLTVTLLPPSAHGQWRFPWEFGWHNTGDTVTNLVAGNYPLEFRNVPGYLASSLQPVPVTGGGPTTVTNTYYPTASGDDALGATGSLTVFLGPSPPLGAGWRFLGDTGPFLKTGFSTNLPPGTYLIEFATAAGRVKPQSEAVPIAPGIPFTLSVNYPLAATAPDNIYRPFPVPVSQISDVTKSPFGFVGQLQSDTGYGSGVAISTNVVLTAAHLIFDDQTLSYVGHAHWFSRREAGVIEPLPQAARAFYVLSGYGNQRTNDLANGYAPEQSTPPSRNLDVAALYFGLPVAGGAYAGYLPSDTMPNTWLNGNTLKMLAGYPVDGSLFGDASIVPGVMYQTDPQPYPLSLAPDPVPGQSQTYLAPWLLSYPGNSGGPLFVQLNSDYYPAAVYLGTVFSGDRPYASVVRAIDRDVVGLITQAAALGDNGTNYTGGGVIRFVGAASGGGGTTQPRLTVNITPPEAAAKAVWKLGFTLFGKSVVYTNTPGNPARF